MTKHTLTLQPTEAVVFTASANIYAAYIAAGQVPQGQEQEWMERAIREALLIAKRIDDSIQSDEEMG